MRKDMLRKLRWDRVALVLLASLLILAGMASCHGLIHYNGTVYRKRVVLFIAMVLASAALAARVTPEDKRWKYSRPAFVILGIAAGAIAFQWISCITTRIVVVKLRYIPLMFALSAVIYWVVWLLVWDSRIAVMVYYWLMCLCGYAYKCVYVFRGLHFRPADLLSFGTALTVVGEYQFTLDYGLLFWCLGGVLLWCLSGMVKKEKMQFKAAKLVKPVGLVLSAGLIWGLISTNILMKWGIRTTSFEENVDYFNRLQGTLTSLVKECQQLKNVRPSDYRPDELASIDERLLQSDVSENQVRPNVFVIMNESLSDLASFWKIDVNSDPLDYLHSLSENTVRGNLYVSAYGGSTCDSEHSFITSTAPAPMLNMPLFTTAQNRTPSLAWLMKAEGYSTIAMHPYVRTNYQRDMVYPRLGFDEFISEESFEGAEMVRTFISDRACYQKIISLFEEKQEDERLFVFNVTMQNHGNYSKGKIEKRYLLTDGTNHPELEEYLNVIGASDDALEELIHYFEGQQEPCVILVFGDHQPKLDLSMFEKQDHLSHLEQSLTQYITSFVIWANYPIETGDVEALSINYLSALLQQVAGLPMTGYHQWLLETANDYPVSVVSGYADADNHFYSWDDGEWPQPLQQLNHLRYNRLYDAENRLPALDFTDASQKEE